ncbi:hypothetical protein NDU88_006340 [Pleurodeles waltl]|uniref:Uncharacterized protein n=1 Tax=Pleurodeles waltl TaxID=8319 RepID=A0AAV7TEU7_PLEWA|nr:hypothetical protein NDU88_006340 [Pleurodeles waltl]
MGFAPAGVAVPGEQSPGPSGIQRGLCAQYAEAALRGEWRQQGSSVALLQVLDTFGDKECELDFEERSTEEGELLEEGEEEEWWADTRGGGVAANFVAELFQGARQVHPRSAGLAVGRNPAGEAEGTGVATVIVSR